MLLRFFTSVCFTDGACEGIDRNIVTVGGVLFDSRDSTFEFFGFHVSQDLVKEWKSRGVTQVIGQAEVYPVLLIKMRWKTKLHQRRCIFFLDSDAARESLVKASTGSDATRDMLLVNSSLDTEIEGLSWYSRVPTESNIGDDPSRLDFSELLELGAVRVHPVQPASLMRLAEQIRQA